MLSARSVLTILRVYVVHTQEIRETCPTNPGAIGTKSCTQIKKNISAICRLSSNIYYCNDPNMYVLLCFD